MKTDPKNIVLKNGKEYNVDKIIRCVGDLKKPTSLKFEVKWEGYPNPEDCYIGTDPTFEEKLGIHRLLQIAQEQRHTKARIRKEKETDFKVLTSEGIKAWSVTFSKSVKALVVLPHTVLYGRSLSS